MPEVDARAPSAGLQVAPSMMPNRPGSGRPSDLGASARGRAGDQIIGPSIDCGVEETDISEIARAPPAVPRAAPANASPQG